MVDPERTIELLDRLEPLGYDNAVHKMLHHKPDDTIKTHRRYCRRGVKTFQPDSNNHRFQRRLALVLGAYEGGSFEPGHRDVLFRLAETARRLIPPHDEDPGATGKRPDSTDQSQAQLRNDAPDRRPGADPGEAGLYLVRPLNAEPVPAVRERSIRVTRECCKVGRADRLGDRARQYERTSGRGNVEFRALAQVTDLEAAERRVLERLEPYRIRAGETGARNEWLSGITPSQVEAHVFACLDEAGIDYVDLRSAQ